MLHFCTSCDITYLLKGLALYSSLQETMDEPYELHWLCIDEEIYTKLAALSLPNIKPYRLESDDELEHIKTLPNSLFGDDYANYCWHLTPWFVHKMLCNQVGPDEQLIYCDSDIYFYHSPKIITKIMGAKSVGIHTHRFGGSISAERETGNFNVGVMAFTRNRVGLAIAGVWKDWVFNPGRPLYEKYSTCGDQRWLDLFVPVFLHNVSIFDLEGCCSHLAPWNIDNIQHTQKHYVEWGGGVAPVVFFHFSHFRFNTQTDQWWDSLKGEWNPAKDPNITPYYADYYKTIKECLVWLT